ncbi:hypothetical protein BGZ63DRAFT_268390 [Mariannaea sp. PMI_226]|nr:hypothetical protein BGZ63DRAFT_268390 [Mariannaea sp. PMI_226]
MQLGIACITLLLGFLPVDASPVSQPKSLDSRADLCENYRFMSLGQLEVQNSISKEFRVLRLNKPMSATDSLNGYHPGYWLPGTIKKKGFYEFDRDAELANIPRDTDFYLALCDPGEEMGKCFNIPGKFQVPSPGKKQWVAKVTVSRLCTMFDCLTDVRTEAECYVDRPMRDAWYP